MYIYITLLYHIIFHYIILYCIILCAREEPTYYLSFNMIRTADTPNLPTKIIPTKIAWLKLSRKFTIDMRIRALNTKIMLESNPVKSIMLWKWAVKENNSKEQQQYTENKRTNDNRSKQRKYKKHKQTTWSGPQMKRRGEGARPARLRPLPVDMYVHDVYTYMHII